MPHDYAKEPYEKLQRDSPELKVTVELTIRLHANGALSVSGPVGDPKLCFFLLEQAGDAVKRQNENRLVVPAQDVGVVPASSSLLPAFPLREPR